MVNFWNKVTNVVKEQVWNYHIESFMENIGDVYWHYASDDKISSLRLSTTTEIFCSTNNKKSPMQNSLLRFPFFYVTMFYNHIASNKLSNKDEIESLLRILPLMSKVTEWTYCLFCNYFLLFDLSQIWQFVFYYLVMFIQSWNLHFKYLLCIK